MFNERGWKNILARDLIAMGSIPLFVLIVVRIWLLDKPFYLTEVFIAGALFLLLAYFFKANTYAGFGLIAIFFTGSYYSDLRYWIFVGIIYAMVLLSLFYEKRKKISLGVILGIICSWIGNFISSYSFG